MKRIYADSSSLLLAAKIDLLDLFLQRYELYITPKIYQEIIRPDKDEFKGIDFLQFDLKQDKTNKHIHKGKSITIIPNSNLKGLHEINLENHFKSQLEKLDEGEKELIITYLLKEDFDTRKRRSFILCDDGSAAKLLNSVQIPFTNALLLLRILLLDNFLSKKDYDKYKSDLLKIAYYSQKILKKADLLSADEIKHFGSY